jgi:SecD/SecF fusion protein
VVFDRIRERLRGRTREPLSTLVNDACLQTIPRTVNTGLGALFILVALFLLGGETLTDFALALLVGIAVGTWSSLFVAAPLLVAFERRASGQPTPAPRPGTREPATATVAAATRPSSGADGRRGSGTPARSPGPRPKPRSQAARPSNRRRR